MLSSFRSFALNSSVVFQRIRVGVSKVWQSLENPQLVFGLLGQDGREGLEASVLQDQQVCNSGFQHYILQGLKNLMVL